VMVHRIQDFLWNLRPSRIVEKHKIVVQVQGRETGANRLDGEVLVFSYREAGLHYISSVSLKQLLFCQKHSTSILSVYTLANAQ